MGFNSFNPLGHTGVAAANPPGLYIYPVPPTSNDWQNFVIGDFWVDRVLKDTYQLMSIDISVPSPGLPPVTQASWALVGAASGDLLHLTADGGVVVQPLAGNINIVGDGSTVTVTGDNATHTLTIAATGSTATQYDEDSGSAIPAANILQIKGGTSTGGVATNINTRGSGNLVEVCLNNSISQPDTNAAGTEGMYSLGSHTFMHNYGATPSNVFLGRDAGNLTNTGATSIGIGGDVLGDMTTGTANIGIGNQALRQLTSGTSNIGIGSNAGDAITTGANNTVMGTSALQLGNNNRCVAIGNASLQSNSGDDNIAVGYNSASAYLGAESNNITIGSDGVLADSGVIRIGRNGTQTSAYITGIDGVNVGSVSKVVTMASDQLGTATITAGTGITVTPGANTITIATNGTSTLTYTSVNTTPYVVLSTDQFLGVDCSGGPITVQLPNAPSAGRVFYIKDTTGSANTNAITVTTVGGVVNIDAAATYSMNTQYAAISVIFTGSQYSIF